jgi:hypothetical protein
MNAGFGFLFFFCCAIVRLPGRRFRFGTVVDAVVGAGVGLPGNGRDPPP